MLGAIIVFMSVQWTVASAAFKAALPASHSFFYRTRKGGGAITSTRIMAMPEMLLGALLTGWRRHELRRQYLPSYRGRPVRNNPAASEPAVLVCGRTRVAGAPRRS
jgi:hypothetical protein